MYILLSCCLSGGLACHSIDLAGGKKVSGAAENQTAENQTSEKISQAVPSNRAEPEKAPESIEKKIEGTYKLNNYRAGRSGYVSALTVGPGQSSGGKINVYFEGTYIYPANGAETFHETAAAGDLQIKGNRASGRLIEEGSENGCAVELNFSGEKVNLKSSDCNLNVAPDGIYQKSTARAPKNDIGGEYGDIPEERDNTMKNSPAERRAFIQYDAGGEPNGIVNLMATAEERVGCDEDILPFAGQVVSVDHPDDLVYEFTLADSRRKRQKISLIVDQDDRLSPAGLRSIIRVGNYLEVTYINCGNAPIASPTAIYLQ